MEPFFTTKEVGEGSGLGLSMVYGFIHQSDGHVGITSSKGEGTAISLYLPIAEVDRTDMDDALSSTATVQDEKTILIVEDNKQVRKTTAATLTSLGYKVIEAEDGPSAQEVLDTKSDIIDLVFSDVIMPAGINGFDLATDIEKKHPHIKVLLTSGYPDMNIAPCAPEDPGKANVDLLRKPFKRTQLAAAVERALSGR